MADVKKLDGGGVMISTSPTDSYILDDEELEAVVGIANEFQTNSERVSNEFQTRIERESKEVQTRIERNPNENQKRKKQTLFATASRLSIPSESPSDILKANKELVRLLGDKNFIRSNSPYGKKGNPNFFSVPNQITDAVNRQLGTDYKNGYMAKVWLSMKYQERFSPVFVKFLCVVWFCSLVLIGWWFGFRGENSVDRNSVSAEQKENFDFRKEVERWQTKNHYYFSGWRLANEIKNHKATSLQELDKYLNNQRTIQGASFTELQKW